MTASANPLAPPRPGPPTGPLRVLMLTTSYPRFDGDYQGQFVAALAGALSARGDLVSVLAPHSRGLRLKEAVGSVCVRRFRYMPQRWERTAYGEGILSNIRHDLVAALGLPAFVWRMRSEARREAREADVVHVHWATNAALAAAGSFRRPVVVTLHGSDVDSAAKGALGAAVLASGLRQADVITVPCEAQRERVGDEWAGKIEVIPNGVDLHALDAAREHAHEARRKLDAERPLLLFVGRLLEQKGVFELLRAFARLPERHAQTTLALVGSGPCEPGLREQASRLGISGRVRFLGARPHPETLELIAASDLLVQPSCFEGFGVTVIEALALGVPVVASRTGVAPEVVDADRLFEPGDTDGLGESLARALDDLGPAGERARAAALAVRARFSWDGAAESMEAVYARAARARSAKPERTRPRPVLTAAKLALAAAIVFFVWRSVSAGFERSDFSGLEFSLPYLAASWAALLCYYLMFTGGLALVFRALGAGPSFRDTFKVSFASNLGKYLPGGVWPVAGRLALVERAGVSRWLGLVATVVESSISVVAGLLVFLAAAALGAPVPASISPAVGGAGAAVVLVGLFPGVFRRVVAMGMRMLRLEGEAPHVSFPALLGLVAYYSAAWTVAGSAFYLFTRSLTATPAAGPFAYAGYYAAGAVGGFLVLIAPAGLGVREGILMALLGPVLGAGTATVVALSARVWSTLLELSLSAVAVALPYSRASATAEREAGEQAAEASR